MALIKCTECGSLVSEYAEHCRMCGCPVEIIKETANKERSGNCKNCLSVGDSYYFGKYPQTEKGEARPIEWKVLEVKNGEALLISKYGLDAKPYSREWKETTWKKCTLRMWLNVIFYNSAFNGDEKRKIQTASVPDDENPAGKTEPKKNTGDKVFLLSIAETEKYFKSDEERKCVPTAYARKHGAFACDDPDQDGKATCWWWLRSSLYPYSAATVLLDGTLFSIGYDIDTESTCVRPAIRIKL